MEDVENWIKECDGKTFIDAMGLMTTNIYDTLEHKKSKSHKVTDPLVQGTKKALDFIMRECNRLNTDNQIMKARLEDRKEYLGMMTELAQKITRTSVSSVEDPQHKPMSSLPARKEEFAVIVTPKTESQDAGELKEKIKLLCKEKENFPAPTDVVVTKARQVIMRYKNRKELETARDRITESEEVKEMARINVPIRKRERVLVLSVDPAVTEQEVKKELEAHITVGGVEDSYVGLTDRIETTTMDSTTKLILEGLLKKPSREVRIIRKIDTRMGKHNWLVDVDAESKKALLSSKRICIDFERYRVVEFVSIMRCFRCQKFGHLANNCDGEQHCPKCAEGHSIKDCKSHKVSCSNCYFENATANCEHRADSTSCPVFVNYREGLLPRRS